MNGQKRIKTNISNWILSSLGTICTQYRNKVCFSLLTTKCLLHSLLPSEIRHANTKHHNESKKVQIFKKKIFCPFDDLGCKCGYYENIQDGHLTTDNSKMILEEPLEERKSDSDEDGIPISISNEFVMDIENEVLESLFETTSFDTIEDTLFCTSTPKKQST